VRSDRQRWAGADGEHPDPATAREGDAVGGRDGLDWEVSRDPGNGEVGSRLPGPAVFDEGAEALQARAAIGAVLATVLWPRWISRAQAW
jgi:hypothetical protein